MDSSFGGSATDEFFGSPLQALDTCVNVFLLLKIQFSTSFFVPQEVRISDFTKKT